MMVLVDAPTALVQRPARRTFRFAIVAVSIVLAVAGTILLVATRQAGSPATTGAVAATLQVPSHPGAVVAGRGALWLALKGKAGDPVGEKPLLRLDLGTGAVQRTASVAGEATSLTRVGDRLIASVRHFAEPQLGGRRLMALDWRSGRVLATRGFNGPVDQVAVDSGDLWALETEPGTLLHLDARTLAPMAPPLRLTTGRALDVASGAGYIWVTAADDGELLRIDPTTGQIRRVEVGGVPEGVVVAGSSVWYADDEAGAVGRVDVETLDPIGDLIPVRGHPTGLAAARDSVFVSQDDGTVSRLDAATGRAGGEIRIALQSAAGELSMAAVGSSVWVSSSGADTVSRVVTEPVTGPVREVLVSGRSSGATLPRGARLVASIPIPSGFNAFAVGEGAVWVLNNDSSTLMRIDPTTNAIVARTRIVDTAEDAAAGAGALWITHPAINAVSRVDPATNAVMATIPVGSEPAGIAVSGDAIWVANAGDPSVSRIDPRTNRVMATIPVGPPRACCAEHMSLSASTTDVWVADSNGDALVRIDPETNTATTTVKVPYTPCGFVVANDDAVWSAGGSCSDAVGRLDPRTRTVVSVLEGEPHPVGLALAFGSLWVAALRASSVDRLDPETGRLVSRLRVGGNPVRVRVGFGSIWVDDDTGRVLRIQPRG
jgi:YVTN family beta-propeller protein